jgi:hypothetical protein
MQVFTFRCFTELLAIGCFLHDDGWGKADKNKSIVGHGAEVMQQANLRQRRLFVGSKAEACRASLIPGETQ